MALFKKKVVAVEAFQVPQSEDGFPDAEMERWLDDACSNVSVERRIRGTVTVVMAPKGRSYSLTARSGDWIIRDSGELYTRTNKEFVAVFEPVKSYEPA